MIFIYYLLCLIIELNDLLFGLKVFREVKYKSFIVVVGIKLFVY